MMDGSTDISGDEQEAVYICFSEHGKVVDKFLGIGTPSSTTAKHLQEFIVKMCIKMIYFYSKYLLVHFIRSKQDEL
jgi:hypothetical protein